MVLGVSCRGGQLAGAAGELVAEPGALNFSSAWVGHENARSLQLRNTGASGRHASLTVVAPWVLDALELDVPGGASIEVSLRVRPLSAGPLQGTLTVATDTGQRLAVTLTGEAKPVPECPAPSDCQLARFDPVRGTCSEVPGPDGASCGAGNVCITHGVCSAGQCLATLLDCDDHNACTQDSCNPQSGCLHEDSSSSCPTPGNRCSVAVCDPSTGCGVAPAEDGARCGPSDCSTAQVCVSGACVGRSVPEGDTCALASICQGPGVCTNKVCVRGAAAALQPAWTYVPSPDRKLQFNGVVDLDGNIYFVEWTVDGKYTDLVSLEPSGAERFRAALPSCGPYGCGYSLNLALDTDGGRVFVSSHSPQRISARSMGNGRLLWDHDPTVGLPVSNRGSNGQAVFGVGAPLLLGSGQWMGVEVSEGNTDHWSHVVLFDRATGQPAPWRISKKGHTYGLGSWGSGDFSMSSANCWAPAGELAHFAPGGSQTQAQFASGGAEAFSADFVWVSGTQSSLLIPPAGSPVQISAPAGGSFAWGEGLLSGTRLIVATNAGPARYELNDYDTRTGLPRWRVPLPRATMFTAAPDLVLLKGGGVFAAAATMTNTGVVATFDAQGTELLSCPLSSAPQSPAAVRSGNYYVQLEGAVAAFSLPGLDTATGGWVSQRGSPARDRRAR